MAKKPKIKKSRKTRHVRRTFYLERGVSEAINEEADLADRSASKFVNRLLKEEINNISTRDLD